MTVDPWSAERGRTFGAVAGLYAATRPEYPPEAIAWVAGPGCRNVLDLGAGTGKLTAGLVSAGWQVTAVEPLLSMLAQLGDPGVWRLAGAAEQIPMRESTMDAVFAGQAFHWFRTDEAIAEIARVLRPAGRLGLMWNLLDVSVSWVAELSGILHERAPEAMVVSKETPIHGKLFTGVQRRRFAHPGQQFDLPGLLDLVRSRSYIVSLPPDEHASVLRRVSDLVRDRRGTGNGSSITVPYVTDVWRATKA